MYIFLIIWFIFLFVYIIFNVYGLYRISSMRIKGDATGIIVLVYLIVMLVIIVISISIISRLSWGQNLKDFFKFF